MSTMETKRKRANHDRSVDVDKKKFTHVVIYFEKEKLYEVLSVNSNLWTKEYQAKFKAGIKLSFKEKVTLKSGMELMVLDMTTSEKIAFKRMKHLEQKLKNEQFSVDQLTSSFFLDTSVLKSKPVVETENEIMPSLSGSLIPSTVDQSSDDESVEDTSSQSNSTVSSVEENIDLTTTKTKSKTSARRIPSQSTSTRHETDDDHMKILKQIRDGVVKGNSIKKKILKELKSLKKVIKLGGNQLSNTLQNPHPNEVNFRGLDLVSLTPKNMVITKYAIELARHLWQNSELAQGMLHRKGSRHGSNTSTGRQLLSPIRSGLFDSAINERFQLNGDSDLLDSLYSCVNQLGLDIKRGKRLTNQRQLQFKDT